MNIIKKHMKFFGSVQGVGFRYRAQKSASLNDITGWVRNNDDGSVEMEAQGIKEQIDKMIELIKNGSFIEIENMEEQIIPLRDDEYEFNIKDYY